MNRLTPVSPMRGVTLCTRILVPGAVMSILFFWPGPAFLVSAHCTAHLLIPALFR